MSILECCRRDVVTAGLDASVRDAAMLINDYDPELARETKERWRKCTTVDKPHSIGKCQRQSQTELYQPGKLADFVKIIECDSIIDKSELCKKLRKLVRPVRLDEKQKRVT